MDTNSHKSSHKSSDKYAIQHTSQDLDPMTVKFRDSHIQHIKDKIERIVPITTQDNKSYYVMTELLPPGSVYFTSKCINAKDGKRYYINTFILHPKKSTSDINTDTGSSADIGSDIDTDTDIDTDSGIGSDIDNNNINNDNNTTKNNINNDNVNVNNNSNISDTITTNVLTHKLGAFQRGMTDRIKYMMMIPSYADKKTFALGLNTIKINNTILYRNIIEFQNKKNNFSYSTVKSVLANCKYRLLLKVVGLLVTSTNVLLSIRLVRIYLDNLDPLPPGIKLNILSELNTHESHNLQRYNELNIIQMQYTTTKKQTKDDLLKIFHIPNDKPNNHYTFVSRNANANVNANTNTNINTNMNS
jgi:hypothetical protein